MKRLAAALVVLLAAVSVGLVAREDPGYVVIGYGPWTVETTLALVVVALLTGFLILYYLIRITANTWLVPRRVRQWSQHRRLSRSRKLLTHGLIELAEGHWPEAERSLLKYAAHSETPLLNYLAAARAAQEQGAHDRRDNYLLMAHQSMPAADVAVGLTQAELQLSHSQMEQALATLMHLRSIAPKHAYVLKMLMDLYIKLQDWEHLIEILPELRKRKVLAQSESDTMEVKAYAELLGSAARSADAEAVHDVWNRVPSRLRFDKGVLYTYLQILVRRADGERAEPLLREAIKHNWDEYLVYLYGVVEGADAVRQLEQAERWLKLHGKSPMLFMSLGGLSMRNQLWGKARGYLEASIEIAPRAEAYRLLGKLLEQTEEKGAALECYRKALELTAEARRGRRSRIRQIEQEIAAV